MPAKIQERCMNAKLFKRSKGTSLIEVMIAIVVLAVVVVGALGFRYYAMLDAKEATIHTTAARIALLFCENWRGVDGDQNYDPVVYLGDELQITSASGTGTPAQFSGFTSLGTYKVSLDNFYYYVALGWTDIDDGLRELNVVVGRKSKSVISENYGIDYSFNWDDQDNKLFNLTTYVTTN